jgi:hypothetical protein
MAIATKITITALGTIPAIIAIIQCLAEFFGFFFAVF